MKFIALGFAITFAIFMGFFPSVPKAKPFWWKLMSVLIVSIAVILTILPPLSGSFGDAIDMHKSPEHRNVDVFLQFKTTPIMDSEKGIITAQAFTSKPYTISGLIYDKDQTLHTISFENTNLDKSIFNTKDKYVLNLVYNQELNTFKYNKTISVNPIFTYPYIPALIQRIRILNFHVPMSWTAFIAFFISMFYAIKYLRTKNLDYDVYASSSALLGLIFTILATTTGMVWARFNWGAFWNWDPRQISIFVLLMIYLAYFALRSSFDSDERKATLSSVYSIISFVTVPFLIFIVPRLYKGLHPGAKGDENTGPVISPDEGMLDSMLAFTYYISLAGFIIVFFWLLNLLIRYTLLDKKIKEQN
jgi:heme exporter protein C